MGRADEGAGPGEASGTRARGRRPTGAGRTGEHGREPSARRTANRTTTRIQDTPTSDRGTWKNFDDLCDPVAAYVDRFNHRRRRGQIQTIPPARPPGANQHAPAPAAAAQQTTTEDGTGHLPDCPVLAGTAPARPRPPTADPARRARRHGAWRIPAVMHDHGRHEPPESPIAEVVAPEPPRLSTHPVGRPSTVVARRGNGPDVDAAPGLGRHRRRAPRSRGHPGHRRAVRGRRQRRHHRVPLPERLPVASVTRSHRRIRPRPARARWRQLPSPSVMKPTTPSLS